MAASAVTPAEAEAPAELALAAAAASPAGVPLVVPLAEPVEPDEPGEPPDEPPVPATPVVLRELTPAAVFAVPGVERVPEPPDPAVPPADAAAAAAAAEEVGGGERLPDTGNCPPPDPSLGALFPAGLRADDLAAALLSADAKSLPSALWAEKSLGTDPPDCGPAFIGWATLMRGGRGITGIAFIPV